MFTEYKCGCISGTVQGTVRYCPRHRKNNAVVEELDEDNAKVKMQYPANGVEIANWNGGR